ncbi:MAG: helix-turn-helix domain-containing protein [Thermodesulfobacteriota bacterium]
MATTHTETDGALPRLAYGVPELARALGCSAAFLRLEAQRGKLRMTRLGRRTLVLREDAEAYIAAGRGDA